LSRSWYNGLDSKLKLKQGEVMKAMITTIVLLATLCMAENTDSTDLSSLNFKGEITFTDLWNSLDGQDSIGKLGDDNLIYYKNNATCYLLIDILYSIVIEKGNCGNLKIGMKKRDIIKKLGKTRIETFPSRELLNYSRRNYTMTLEVKNKKLTSIKIYKNI